MTMKMFLLLLLLVTFSFCAGQENATVVNSTATSISRPVEPDVVPINYTHEGYALQGFKATPDVATADNPVPAIVIIP